jgi:hypothetical protein
VSDQPPQQPPPEQPYTLPGTTSAWEPSTLPNRPVTAADATPFLQKIIA